MTSEGAPELLSIWDAAKDHIDQGDHDRAAEIYNYILLMYGNNDVAVCMWSATAGQMGLCGSVTRQCSEPCLLATSL